MNIIFIKVFVVGIILKNFVRIFFVKLILKLNLNLENYVYKLCY